jgi:hypothetical protein
LPPAQPLAPAIGPGDNPRVPADSALNLCELRRYMERVGERWPVERAILGGARVDDEHGAPSQRERGAEYVVILVSSAWDGMPWLERVYQAGALWDALEMGAAADVHCYTPAEFERKRQALAQVRAAVERGLQLTGPEPAVS